MDDRLRISQEVELRRCAEDFVYFCETYVKINHPTHGLIPFTLHAYQKRYAQALQDNRFLITKKFRQGGFSTLSVVWALWRCLFKLDERIAFLSKTDREAIELGYIVDRVIKHLPDWMQPKMEKQNGHQKVFADTKCSIRLLTPIAACGISIHHLFIDEAAFIDNLDSHWKAMYPTIATGGHCYVLSTPNGTGNWFHETYTGAEKLQNNFKVFHSSYLEHPDYSNTEWAFNTKQALGANGWRQEVLAEFIPHDSRTPQERSADALQFFEDVTAAEMLVESFTDKSRKPQKLPKSFNFDNSVPNIRNFFEHLEDAQLKGLDWSCDELYTDVPKAEVPPHVDLEKPPEYKPQVYQFKIMTWAEQQEFLKKYHDKHKPFEFDSHPEMDQFQMTSSDDLAEFWTEYATVFPFDDYAKIRDYWVDCVEERKRKEQEMEDKINEFVAIDELVMAGLISAEEAKTLKPFEVFGRPDLKIIDSVHESKRYPKEMNISFENGKLCVNRVPTNIKEEDVRDLYNGMFSLVGYKQAIENAVKAITTKLDGLFGEEPKEDSNEESLDK